ncbi:MAG TPA: hypothetical protein VE089_04345, partial [Nitrososphaeraceae archaeon]|nr:hypothetical protein [Nitrososphaeraceae archaeon]
MSKYKRVMVIEGFSVISVMVIILGLQGIAVQKSVLAAAYSDTINNVAADDSKIIQNRILFTN